MQNMSHKSFSWLSKLDKINPNFISFFVDSKLIIKQWKKQMAPALFPIFIEIFSDKVCDLIKRQLKRAQFSLLGALYLDKIVRELKSFFQSLTPDKPIIAASTLITNKLPFRALLELMDIAQVLSCENIDEIETYLTDKY